MADHGAVRDRLCLPEVDEKALAGLKFSDALPRHLAVATLAARLADLDHAQTVLWSQCCSNGSRRSRTSSLRT
jgi:hypothetical protein